ncbi:MAG: response regulator transcription factor [Burkholderiales bacterium]|nr:response regulator transcription factor [Burkholderiales bacterium]
MRVLKAVIAEDEPVLRLDLRHTLARLWPELEICADVEDGFEALHALHEHAPAILFLDIEMPGLSGLEVARQASGKCHIVFVTAFDSYAVAAFEQGAVDYVLKPFSAARLATSVARLRERVGGVPKPVDGLLEVLDASAKPVKEFLRWITASQGDDLRLITVDEICYIKADNKYAVVVTPHQDSVIRRPIKELIDELDPRMFCQIHRGTVVNVNAIAGVTRSMSGQLCVKLKQRKETLPVSESYAHLFKQM